MYLEKTVILPGTDGTPKRRATTHTKCVRSQSAYFDFLETHMGDFHTAKRISEHLAIFNAWSSRYHGLLYFTACRVLGGQERADDAVQKCLLAASRNPPRFDSEGAFRSWLVRILIDEALLILLEERCER